MKNIIKLFSIILVFAAFACEPDEYAVPDIELVPVYTISETGNDDFSTIRVYQQKNLLTIVDGDGAIVALDTKDYADTSDDINYIISAVALDTKMVTDDEGNESEVQITHVYAITAVKETGECVLTITSYDENSVETKIATINGVLMDTEIYN